MFLTVIKSWKEKSLQATLCDYGDFNEILRASNSQKTRVTKTPDTLPSALNSSKMEKLQK